MMEKGIRTLDQFREVQRAKKAVLFYFATMSCSVGEALEPKVREMIRDRFPRIEFIWIDMNAAPEVCGEERVFVEPTLILYMDDKEFLRKSRNINLQELGANLQRLYDLAF